MTTDGSGESGAIAAGTGGGGSKGPIQAAIDGLVQIAMSLPMALRALIAFGMLAMVGLVVYEKSKVPESGGLPPVVQTATNNQPYWGGTADPGHAGADNTNPQNIEAAHKSAEDDAAYKWHFDHPDNTQEIALGDGSNPNEFLHYKYFAKSDKCLYIRRKEGNKEYSQWLPNPVFSQHSIDQSTVSRRVEPRNEPKSNWLWAQIATTAFAATPQAANCQNPHPGTFRYWWGKPVDSCRSPMYRQFQDGCTHYQIYNRCSNAWENEINWTFCTAGGHH